MNNSFSETYFVDGGTLRANTPSYVKRPADDELYEALMDREYCYILTPRQMGKSSLMIHTSQRLKDQNIKTAIVDIQGIGSNKDREWYASLLSQIRRGLKLSVDIEAWMKQKSNIGLGQLFIDFVQDVILVEISEQVVIFLDEVDWMIKIDFRDDFFASIRSIYNARANYPEFNRVSFVLLGVASPADLISEPTRTPFNIGHAIPLQELSLDDAKPLQDGLEQVCPGQGKLMLERIFYWTNGHPYLTQKLCKYIAESTRPNWSDAEVDDLVERLFLAEESRKEANLKFIQDRILSSEQFAQMLKLYKRVRQTKVKENGQSILQNQLMLSGLLTTRNGYLEVRNKVYEAVFNDKWINKNTPKNSQRIALITLGVTLGIIILATLAIFINDFFVGSKVNSSIADFISTNSSTQRLTDLANIYNQKGILSNTDSSLQAAQLFYGLSAKDQLAMFTDYAIDSNVVLQDSLLTVIEHLYVTVADVGSTNNNTQLLKTMRDSLDKVSNNSDALQFKKEITSWLDGRDQYHAGNYVAALTSYNNAINLNSNNPATTYERAKVFIGLKQYDKALLDLDTTINLAKQTTKQDEKDLVTPTATITTVVLPTETASLPVTRTLQPSSTSIATTIIDNTVAPFVTQPSSSTPSLISTVPAIQPVTPTAVSPLPDKFESKFSTFIEIVNAVRTLIDKDSALQDAIPVNGATTYANLDSVGLVKAYARTPTTTVSFASEKITSTAFPILTSTLSTDQLAMSGWPMEGHDAQRTGFNSTETRLSPPLNLLWTKSLPNYYAEEFTVLQNRLAISGNGGRGTGVDTNQVYMLDASTGDILWDFILPHGGSGAMDVAPVQSNTSVFLGGQGDTQLYAVDRETGKQIWTDGGIGGLYGSKLALVNNYLIVPDDVNGVTVLDANSGVSVWGTLSGAWGLPSAVDGGKVFSIVKGSVVAKDISNGSVLWEFSGLQSSAWTWFSVGNNLVYVNFSNTDIIALDEGTGKLMWRSSLPVKSVQQGGEAALAYGKLYVTIWEDKNSHGELFALDAKAGNILWQFDTSAQGVLHVAVANQVVYFTGYAAQMLYALDANTGVLLWSYKLDCNGGDLVIANGVLYVEACNYIYAFGNSLQSDTTPGSNIVATQQPTSVPDINLTKSPNSTSLPTQSLLESTYTISQCCNSSGQRSSALDYSVEVNTPGVLQLRFSVGVKVCSDIVLHILLDGDEVYQTDPIGSISGNLTTSLIEISTKGVHTLTLSPEGVVGGCNTGTLGSWGGTLTVRTSQNP